MDSLDPVDPVAFARRLIDIDSTTGSETEAGAWLARFLRDRGYRVVEQPIYEMARLAADLLVERATGVTTDHGARRILRPSLHVAATTGPPR